MKRTAKLERKTKETEVAVELALEGKGSYHIRTPVPFLDHMLSLLAQHGYFDLKVQARGDMEVDAHHTVEDLGILLGDAFHQALGDRRGIRRFGSALTPMDEALASVSIDLSGRPYLSYHAPVLKGKIGNFDVRLIKEFLRAFSNHLQATLHVQLLSGEDMHHGVEAIFKSLARALDEACQREGRSKQIPSTKGSL
ncbi:MAG: imidazoleglycerol-phosphate dehydratase HisB [candidate division NC10 bacterium]|nr:imidazoleglycerol-phosphate dehydratase HisB [candidate division NC10 bacterium]